jgi:uncharacterized protein involved in response to NO
MGILGSMVAVNAAGVTAAMAGWMQLAVFFVHWNPGRRRCASPGESTRQPAKVKGVHSSFPVFVRMAYLWAVAAAGLSISATSVKDSHGIWGASRHALRVGFLAVMVFCVGQSILPAFSGMPFLLNTKLMFVSLLLLSLGGTLRVGSEVLAYQGLASWAWSWLPVSAITEMTAVTLFAFHLLFTFARPRAAQEIAPDPGDRWPQPYSGGKWPEKDSCGGCDPVSG